jgi:hypothetical protein
VKTRTSYLARIRNPNPKMPDAKQIGIASPATEEHVDASEAKHDFHDHDKGTLNPTEQPSDKQNADAKPVPKETPH